MSRKQRRRQEKIARTEAAKQSGNNPDYALQMAGQFFQSGQLDQAIKILEDASGQNPEHFDVNYGLAIIHATNGNLDAALPLFEKAVSIRRLQRRVDIFMPPPHILRVGRESGMAKKAPGKAHRKGLTIVQLMDMFPTEKAATAWFESVIWPDGRHCPKCGSLRTSEASHAKMPYWCTDCRSYFSVKTGTAMQRSKIPLRKWAIAIYLCLTSLKSVSSMKLKRDIGVSQPTAWFMLHRIREAWGGDSEGPFDGPVEFDETYFGGKRRNMSNAQRKELAGTGRGAVGKVAVVGAKDRATNKVAAQVVEATDRETLHDFVAENAEPDAVVYTDDAAAYEGIPNPHQSVKHSVSEYVNGMAHTNGIESFWSMLKRAHKGTFHKISPKHLDRYVQEFAGKHNIRDSGTLVQMRDTVARLVGRNLLYRDLIADNGLSSGSGA